MHRLSSRLAIVIALIALVPIGAFAQPDTDPPVLVDFDFNPKSVDVTNGSAVITCEITATDSPAGVSNVNCNFSTGSSGPIHSCGTGTPTSGTVFDGVWTCDVTIPQYAEEGTWLVHSVYLNDTVANNARTRTAELEQQGYPTELQVGFISGEPIAVIPVSFEINLSAASVSVASPKFTVLELKLSVEPCSVIFTCGSEPTT